MGLECTQTVFIFLKYHLTFIDCTVGWGELTVGPTTYHTVCRTTKRGRKKRKGDGGTEGRTKNIVMEEKMQCSERVGSDGKGRLRNGFSMFLVL